MSGEPWDLGLQFICVLLPGRVGRLYFMPGSKTRQTLGCNFSLNLLLTFFVPVGELTDCHPSAPSGKGSGNFDSDIGRRKGWQSKLRSCWPAQRAKHFFLAFLLFLTFSALWSDQCTNLHLRHGAVTLRQSYPYCTDAQEPKQNILQKGAGVPNRCRTNHLGWKH